MQLMFRSMQESKWR